MHANHVIGIGIGSDSSLTALANAERGFFFERHGLEDFFYIVGIELQVLCLYAPSHEAED